MDPSTVIDRVRQLIESGKDYEAHQQILARAWRSKDVAFTLSVLYQGAKLLIEHGRIDSGIDVSIALVAVLVKNKIKSSEQIRSTIKELLRVIPITQPAAAKLVGKVVDWSVDFGEYTAGDPDIHDVIGALYADASEVYKAESHLLVGSAESVPRLAQLEYDWYVEDEPSTAGLYIGRAVLPYLLLGNLAAANKCLLHFYTLLDTNEATPKPATNVDTPVTLAASSPRIYPDMPLLNFVTLLLVTVSRKDQAMFVKLRNHYDGQIAQSKAAQKWTELLDQIAAGYFNIRQQPATNPLFEMMGSLLGGAGGPGGFGGFGGFGGGGAPPPRQLGGFQGDLD